MTTVQESIDVAVPVSTAYNQWTQFETFPKFMGGVESITQTSDTQTHWVTSIGGVRREFDAEIIEQHPDERVAWKSTDGESHAGVVTFHRIDESTTRLMVQIDWHPETFTEKVGAVVNADAAQVKGDLKRFKEFIEKSGGESSAWRGDVSAPPSGVVGEAEPAGGNLPDKASDDPDSGGPRAGAPGI